MKMPLWLLSHHEAIKQLMSPSGAESLTALTACRLTSYTAGASGNCACGNFVWLAIANNLILCKCPPIEYTTYCDTTHGDLRTQNVIVRTFNHGVVVSVQNGDVLSWSVLSACHVVHFTYFVTKSVKIPFYSRYRHTYNFMSVMAACGAS